MIKIHIDGRNFGKKSGFVVKLENEHFSWVRTVPCGSLTTNQTELRAIEYALKSVIDDFKKDKIVIKSPSQYARMMLERNTDGVWSKHAVSNKELVERVRDLWAGFSDISIDCVLPNDSEELRKSIEELQLLNEKAVKKGEETFDRKSI